MGGVIGGIISSTPVAVPKVATPQRVRVSPGRLSGLLVRKVSRTTRLWPGRHAFREQCAASRDQQGRLHRKPHADQRASHAGASGIDAVKQWKYKPYLLNGEPVEVDTEVQVNFTLSGG
jgi:periplasmic protein TonB